MGEPAHLVRPGRRAAPIDGHSGRLGDCERVASALGIISTAHLELAREVQATALVTEIEQRLCLATSTAPTSSALS